MKSLTGSQKENALALMNDAGLFCRLIVNAIHKGKFNHRTSYNIMCISAEKYMVSYLMFFGVQPNDHNLSGLVKEIDAISGKKNVMLAGMVKYLESFMDLCSLEILEQKPINDDDIFKLKHALLYIREFTEKTMIGEPEVLL
jgi:hypothetical protein